MEYAQDSTIGNNYEASSSSMSYLRPENCEGNVETSHDSYETNTLIKGRQTSIQCVSCAFSDKQKLQQCNTCKVYKCKGCKKREEGDTSNKKRRNPALYVCRKCINDPKNNERVKMNKKMLSRSRDNSIEKKNDFRKNNDTKLNNIKQKDSYYIIIEKNILNLEEKEECIFCKSSNKTVEVFKTYHDVYKQISYLIENNKDDFLFNDAHLIQLLQTVNLYFNSQKNIPLENSIIACTDCFKFCIKSVMTCSHIINISNQLKDDGKFIDTESVYLMHAMKGLFNSLDSFQRLVYYVYQNLITKKTDGLFDYVYASLCENMMGSNVISNQKPSYSSFLHNILQYNQNMMQNGQIKYGAYNYNGSVVQGKDNLGEFYLFNNESFKKNMK